MIIVVLIRFQFMIMRHSMGGDIATQTGLGFVGIYTTVSLFLAYYNIKCLQIDQHRAWMLRAWVVAGLIITQRIIQVSQNVMRS